MSEEAKEVVNLPPTTTEEKPVVAEPQESEAEP